MTTKEFVEKLFGGNINTSLPKSPYDKGCAGMVCPIDTTCATCEYKGFWNKEINLSHISKTVLNMIYGTNTTKYLDTDSVKHIREAFKNGSTHFSFINEPIVTPTITLIDNWVEFPSALIADEVNSIGEILDDATVHGLDFKYENGKFYFKDRQVSLNKDTQDVD